MTYRLKLYNIRGGFYFFYIFLSHTSRTIACSTRFLNTVPPNFRDKDLRSHFEGGLSLRKKREMLMHRNRASTSPRDFLSCQEHVLPLARPPSPGGNHFRPLSPPCLTPDGPLAAALSENMDRP